MFPRLSAGQDVHVRLASYYVGSGWLAAGLRRCELHSRA